ncbi:hypothetical protein GCM10010145_13410 [Streptomyces ruber]|uniref:CBM2 domain-containing protein n=2 Tax=Streptomyces TaxID=1883 RepID=A0A918ERF8_9ACTN|nr:cellulose binding domain-containing protein [Streptomyces ruber]GGQ46032.1 hypothetical protein GCM10010145_13410 [Streptomyces ruber]
MPDLPKPQDATEATLLSECWDAVLSYAGLCTSGSSSGSRLATEAFTRGVRRARAEEARAGRGPGRRAPRLPRIPFRPASVRTTAASWEAAGEGHLLDPGLRLRPHSEGAARHTDPPLTPRPAPAAPTGRGGPEPAPQDEGTTPTGIPHRPMEPTRSTDASCHARYEVVDEWPDGFQATVTVTSPTSPRALDDWRIGWTFPDGQRVDHMWDGSFPQDDARVTADHNRSVTAGAPFGVGFVGSLRNGNGAPQRFTLNGSPCATVR